MSKPISQRKWTKGVIANVPDTAQPPDSFSRASNILFTRRGAARACDGSLLISALNGAISPGQGPWTELFLFQPNNVSRYYIGIQKGYFLGAPSGLAAADGGAGGSLGAGTYRYVINALDGIGGGTPASNEVTITIVANHLINLTWNSLPGATIYHIFRTAVGGAPGTEIILVVSGGLGAPPVNVTTTSFTDDGSTFQGLIGPPTTDTSQLCRFWRIPATSYGPAPTNSLAVFPADPIVPVDGTPGGVGSGGGVTNPSSGAPPTISGGIIGNLSGLPMIVQFANKAFLALGNGFPPQVYADTTQPDWTAAKQTNATDVIKPLTNNAGGFYFVAQNGGTLGGANPVFPQTVGSTVADNNVTWRNIGLIPVFTLFNTFQSTYPDWNANITYVIGDKIKPLTNNAGGFIFSCLQGGVSSNVAPTFPQSQGQTVAEAAHNVLWQNVGVGTNSPAPRAAAHAEVYAGALWVTNTQPTTTSDQLDGPSALRMSDINNPISWNPLNTAFLDRDDGDQTMGLKAMTIAESGIPPTGSLVVFKSFKTFQVNGVFGSSNFSIQRAQTDAGCLASRSIEFCPGFGIIRLTHLGFMLFDTTRDRVISEQIRPYLFADPNITDITTLDWNLAYFSKAAQCADPPMYMCAVPLSLANLPLTAGTVGIASTFTAGNYFFRATKFTLVGQSVIESAVSRELTVALDTGHQVFFSGVPADSLAIKYRIYAAIVPGGYTNFIELTPAQMSANPQFSAFSQFNQSGAPSAGTGGLTRIVCYDLVLKAWAIIDLPFSISVLRQVRAPGSEPLTIIGSFNDGSIRRIQAGDLTWDGTPVNWSFRPAELMSGGGSSRVFYQRLNMKGVASPANLATITMTPAFDSTDDLTQPPINYTFGNGRFASWLDLLTTALTAHVTVSGSGPVEIDSIDWEVEALPSTVPMQFA